MISEEELEQIRQEDTALCSALQRKKEELDQTLKANQDLCE
jgi:hypothetical protein